MHPDAADLFALDEALRAEAHQVLARSGIQFSSSLVFGESTYRDRASPAYSVINFPFTCCHTALAARLAGPWSNSTSGRPC